MTPAPAGVAGPPRLNRQILYAHRPDGRLAEGAFRAVDGDVPALEPGQVLCRTILLSVDAANRAWMQARTYRDQLVEGRVMDGFALSEVVAESESGIPVGSLVTERYAFCDPGGGSCAAARCPSTTPATRRGSAGCRGCW
ncbi:MAG: hypothetical protein ACRDWW_00815 [Acidimicrobiales bacterium]